MACTYAAPVLTGSAALTGVVILAVRWWPGHDRTDWLAPAALISLLFLCWGRGGPAQLRQILPLDTDTKGQCLIGGDVGAGPMGRGH